MSKNICVGVFAQSSTCNNNVHKGCNLLIEVLISLVVEDSGEGLRS
jgi:hypothetical protein